MYDQRVDVQRCLLVLGASVTFLIFVPRGLFAGLAVLALLGARVPRRWLGRFRTRKKASSPARQPGAGAAASAASPGRCSSDGGSGAATGTVPSGEDSTEMEALRGQDPQLQASAGGSSSAGFVEGDWGPSLTLVFEARDPVTGSQRLRIRPSQDGSTGWKVESSEPTRAEASPATCSEILELLEQAHLEYRLGPSRSGEYIFCAVRLPEVTARVNLSVYPLDLPLDSVRARQHAADLGMPLALRTRRWGRGSPCPLSSAFARRPDVRKATEEGVEESVWRDLHIRFVPTVPSSIFRHYSLVPRDDHTTLRASVPACAQQPQKPAGSGQPVVGFAVARSPLGGSSSGWSSNDGDEEEYVELDASPLTPSPSLTRIAPSGDTGESGMPASSSGHSATSLSGRRRRTATTILPPSVRLRLLLSLVTDDLPGALGERGPGLKLDQWRKSKLCHFLLRTGRNFGLSDYEQGAQLLNQLEVPNAFLLYFLMQDPRDAAYLRLCDKFGHPASPNFRRSLFTGISDTRLPSMLRHYFGSQIGFYFAFLQHLFGSGFALTVLLAPSLVVYSVNWARQEEKKRIAILSEFGSAYARQSNWPLWSLLVGLITIIWGQCVLESWRRQEQRLAKEWGSTRAGAGRTLRHHFRGRMALSRIDGRLTQVHDSRRLYQARVLGLNLIYLLSGVTFAAVILLVSCTMETKVADEKYSSMGAAYSIVSIVFYNLFKGVAQLMTEAENHRHEEPYEASALVKKWMLTVGVQCWPLCHLLFLRPWLWPCAYGDSDVRHRLGIDGCGLTDYSCCDVELRRAGKVVLSFAEVRSEAVVRHTRQFVAGWLVSKIFLHNLLKWFVPRLCGFLCTRGLYPLLPVDFAQDLLNDLTARSSNRRRRRVGRTHCGFRMPRFCCCRRRRQAGRPEASARETGPSQLPEEMTAACEVLLDKQDPWDVLDTANDLSVHFLVTSLTTVIYPFSPLLFLAHLFVEFKMDLFRLFDRRQPKPRVANGLPKAWVHIFQSYVYVGALSNLAIVTWRTQLVENMLGRKDDAGLRFAFFSTVMLCLVLVVSLVQLVTPNVPEDVKEHLQRQQEVEAFLTGVTRQAGRRRQVSAPALATSRSWTMSSLHLVGACGADDSEEAPPGGEEEEGNGATPACDTERRDARVRTLWRQAQKVR